MIWCSFQNLPWWDWNKTLDLAFYNDLIILIFRSTKTPSPWSCILQRSHHVDLAFYNDFSSTKSSVLQRSHRHDLLVYNDFSSTIKDLLTHRRALVFYKDLSSTKISVLERPPHRRALEKLREEFRADSESAAHSEAISILRWIHLMYLGKCERTKKEVVY